MKKKKLFSVNDAGSNLTMSKRNKVISNGQFSKTLLPSIFYEKGTGGLATIKDVYILRQKKTEIQGSPVQNYSTGNP